MDTRSSGAVGPGGTVNLQVTGHGGVPSGGVSAVVLNVTATGPTSGSFITVYPSDVARPLASNLNFPSGWTGANAVTVPVSAAGQVSFYNSLGSVQIIADVVGFYAADDSVIPVAGTSGGYVPLEPFRGFDTRDPSFGGPLAPSESLSVSFDFGEFNTHIRALAINVTAVFGSRIGYFATWNGLGDPPNTSTLNFNPNTIVPNMAVVPTATCDFAGCVGVMVGVYNGSTGSTPSSTFPACTSTTPSPGSSGTGR